MCGGSISSWGGSVETDVSDGATSEAPSLAVSAPPASETIKHIYMYCL